MTSEKKRSGLVIIMILYLLGIFMGAIDTGIVTPARTVIQHFLSVDEKTGIWMITIYTLSYAASIPIMGKLADKYGRKYIYLSSIFLFGFGSLLCGLSQNFESFTLLLIARTIQAIGGGGIMPIANAEFGTTFPKEKRGMALGLVGGVYGIANIVGSSAGSAILDLFGKNNWQFIFYINVPITVFILIAGFLFLPNSKEDSVKKIDFFGIFLIVIMILSLLYGLRNIDFFDFGNTITSTKVYPFLILFIVLLPFFRLAEKKAEDPVMNLNYFKDTRIVITLFLSFITGFVMMGMIFVPQFSENILKISSGDGGYFVFILGLFAGVGAPISGKLIDKYGVKLVLGIGFFVSAFGAVFIVLVTTNYPSIITVVISLILFGIGIGFTMGTPLNYMMLDNTKKEEAGSALATVSLVRSIGTAIAPAIMIGFISHAGMAVQGNIMPLLPGEIKVPDLPYAKELSEEFDKLKSDPTMKDKLKDVTIPDLSSMQTVKFDMNSKDRKVSLPTEVITMLQSSDVTTIAHDCKVLARTMFDFMTPDIIKNIQGGIESGITAMQSSLNDIDSGITGIENAAKAQEAIITQLENAKKMFGNPTGGQSTDTQNTTNHLSTTNNATSNTNSSYSFVDSIPDAVKQNIPADVMNKLKAVKTVSDIDRLIKQLNTTVQTMKSQSIAMTTAKSEISDIIDKMTELNNAIPTAFSTAKDNYLKEIDKLSGAIEDEFQDTMNGGFRQLYLTVTIASLLGFTVLMFYKGKRKESQEVDV